MEDLRTYLNDIEARLIPDQEDGILNQWRTFAQGEWKEEFFMPYEHNTLPNVRPMDVCELLWGSDLFTALYDTPDLVHGLLKKVMETYKAFLDEWFRQNPNKDNLHAYFGSAHLGGGSIHFCGRGDHYVQFFSEMAGLEAMNLSQPEYNDMESIYSFTVDKGIPVFALDRQTVDDAIDAGRPLHGLVHTAG